MAAGTRLPRHLGEGLQGCRRSGFAIPRFAAHRGAQPQACGRGSIMQIGGWRTRSVFDRYAIITENDIVDAVRKLEADRKQREIATVEISAISHESVTKSTEVPARVANAKLLN